MVGNEILRIIKPELGHLRENRALFGDFVLQYHVKRGDAVCGDHNEVCADVVDLADFSFFHHFQCIHLRILS